LWRNCKTLSVAILVTLFAASCGGGGTSTPNNNSGTNPASLTLNSSSLDFGNVAVGSSKSNTISLTNSAAAGGPSITVSQITVSGTGYTDSTPTLPLTLAAGQSASMTVTFSPTTAGAQSGTLSVTVSGANAPISVPLTGSGLASGQLGVSPSTMNFGNVTVGSSQNQAGTLTAGSSDVNVSTASWNGLGYSLSGITFPTTVKAGTSAPFTVTFTPQAIGSSSGQVSFVSDATNSPTVVTLTGSGTQATQHSVRLSWNASTSVVSGYNIYRGTSSGGQYTLLNTSLVSGLSFTDSNVQSGTTYYYAATAVDSSNVESGYSNVATAVIP
jgi:hypothetical protein